MSAQNASSRQSVVSQPSFKDQISLNDNSKPIEPTDEGLSTPATPVNQGGFDGPALSRVTTSSLVNAGRLREGIAQRKYARYQKDRYEDEDVTDEDDPPGPSTRSTTAATPGDFRRAGTAATMKTTGGSTREGTLRRGQQKVKGIFWGKKQKRRKDGDAEIDVLWENQRGSFLFGRPYYSSNSLLNFDPTAWTNVYGKSSAVDITSATLPDPSWEWAWKMWYVDMSLDCDEQGWQYSFMFQNRFPWHGTHPWPYSFARRRRWIRKRVRKHRHLPDGRVEGGQSMQDAHKLNGDYFTIHPPTSRSPDSSYPPSTTGPRTSTAKSLVEEESDGVDNIRVLIRRLRKATTDREKISLILQFMDEGGQDVHYLAEEMSHIMSMFLYQYSRRQLLVSMIWKVNPGPTDHRVEGQTTAKKDEIAGARTDAEEDDTPLTQHKKDLEKAVEAADKLVQELEYWSDIKEVVHNGETLTAADESKGWGEGWNGLDNSGPSGPPHTVKDDAGKG